MERRKIHNMGKGKDTELPGETTWADRNGMGGEGVSETGRDDGERTF